MGNNEMGPGLCMVTLDSLVSELLKAEPNEHLVKEWMVRVGIAYSTNPEERISAVLEALCGQKKRKARREDETSV